MPRRTPRTRLGAAARALLVLLVVTGVVLIARLYLDGMLSGWQFRRATGELAAQTRGELGPIARSRAFLGAVAFLAGVAAGWLTAFRWVRHRLRRRPLIIADLRHADMSFADGIHHVRRHAESPVVDDDTAVSLILHEASVGRLTLWRRASTDALWRVPARQVRAFVGRLAKAPDASWGVHSWQNFLLLTTEVERSWPSRTAVGTIIDPGRPIS